MHNKFYLYLFLFMILAMNSCALFEEDLILGSKEDEYSVAFPMINSRVTVGKLASLAKGNVSVAIEPDGKTIVNYNGEVIRRTKSSIFPPLPSLGELSIPDTFVNIPLQFPNAYIIRKAVFQNTKLVFSFEHTEPQDVTIRMQILEVSKNGKIFEQTYQMPYTGSAPSKLNTVPVSVDGWTYQSGDNSLTFKYEAITKDGKRIKLDKAVFNYDIIVFSYIEGYLGYHIYPIQGSVIDVSLFNKWLSGSFDFADPKVSIRVENAFGVPVRSKVNALELTSITGNRVNLQSEFIQKCIDFDFPGLNEIGQLKTTYFAFDTSNSNIRQIFNEKTKTIVYDISAEINADRDLGGTGFINNDSYFTVNVAVEVPLHGSVKDVVLTDTVSFDATRFEDVESGELKMLITNDFPADIELQMYMLDESGSRIGQLMDEGPLVIVSPGVRPDGRANTPQEKVHFIPLSASKIRDLKQSKTIAIVGKINTTNSQSGQTLWIYDDYGMGLKLGALVNLKN